MPLAKRKSGEDRNEFVSRCIKEESDKNNDMTHEMIVAACERQADMSALIGYEEYKDYLKNRRTGVEQQLLPDNSKS